MFCSFRAVVEDATSEDVLLYSPEKAPAESTPTTTTANNNDNATTTTTTTYSLLQLYHFITLIRFANCSKPQTLSPRAPRGGRPKSPAPNPSHAKKGGRIYARQVACIVCCSLRLQKKDSYYFFSMLKGSAKLFGSIKSYSSKIKSQMFHDAGSGELSSARTERGTADIGGGAGNRFVFIYFLCAFFVLLHSFYFLVVW
jgi:hypothetical protein